MYISCMLHMILCRVVSIEIQHVFGREFDGFMKAAHVTGGHYINMDIRQFAHEVR